ncbi:RNA recognition motif (RRM, RBD, or RNP domain) [Novymonas esmeraldas]|uniref:RNA recognition motif (RRM, RBD, or RNP domain) n=1 Tax=Novymonas esmeraldas TaxID=1808958 RepID=A0AAW0F944_9TRYP
MSTHSQSASRSGASVGGESERLSASPSASEDTHSSATDSSSEASSSDSASCSSASSSGPRSASASASTSPRSSRGGSSGDGDAVAPWKQPRLEKAMDTASSPPATRGSASVAPAPSTRPVSVARYGSIFARPPQNPWVAPAPPPLPTLSASAKDISEMDVRAGLRLGVYRAATRLNKEQVMDEVDSVRMTSHVERVLLESPHQTAQLTGVPPQEQEYAWAIVFFSTAEAADLCAALLCQPGRRSKWPRMSIQRLPLMTALTEPYTADEEQRMRVHVYQMTAGAVSEHAIASGASLLSDVQDSVLTRSAFGWCVLSTGGLFPTLGLAAYVHHRRLGDFISVDVCATFDPESAADKCTAGGQCSDIHLRSCHQWRLLVPPVLLSRKAHAGALAATAALCPAETAWQRARHADTLSVMPLPAEIDEAAFEYMFRQCAGFRRAQTVRTADAQRYGVVEFADAASAQLARQQATSSSNLAVRFVGDAASGGVHPAGAGAAVASTAGTAATTTPSGEPTHDAGGTTALSGASEERCSSTNAAAAAAAAAAPAAHSPGVPFPPLPGGWEYGLSRRTMQYFFLQSGKKSTTWKHPVTQEQYRAQR